MKFGDFPLAACDGAILSHSVAGLKKGQVLTAEDLAAARDAGREMLPVAILEDGDVEEGEAAQRIGAALAGGRVRAKSPVHGRVTLEAKRAGLLDFDAPKVTRFNGVTGQIALATLPHFAPVREGEAVATLKIVRFAVEEELVAAMQDWGLAAKLSVLPFQPLKVLLIQTRHENMSEKMLAKTAEVTGARIAALGGTMAEAAQPPHEAGAIADILRGPEADLVLVAGASATSDRRDVIPAAIEAAGGEVLRLGMPVDPGNLLLLGRMRGGTPVIGMPGCARSPKRNGFDMVIERIFAGLEVTSADVAAMGVGGLIEAGARPDG